MSKDTIDRLAALGSLTGEQMATGEEINRASLTMTALAIAVHVLGKVPPEREGGDLKAMKLLLHELAEGDADIWMGRAEYLVDGAVGEP